MTKVVSIESFNKFKGVRGSYQREDDIIKEKVFSGFMETAASDLGNRGDNMKDDTLGILFDELKKDMREREARIHEEILQREKSFEETLKAYQQENKEREERIYQLIKEIQNDNKEFKNELKNEIHITKQEISNLTKHNQSLATTNKWANIATIIGIATISITVIIALFVN